VNGPCDAQAASSVEAEATASGLALPDRPAIAVLPFDNMSGDREQEYFSDGISEDIITALSKLRWFFVIARNSSFTYKGKPVHMRQVAAELGRALRGRRQREKERRSRPHHRAAQRHRDRQPHLGGALRPRA
jgi:TolB-like protein